MTSTRSETVGLGLASQSLSNNVPAHLGKLVSGAKKRLQTAFGSPSDLGPESAIHLDCVRFLDHISTFAPPDEDEGWATYCLAIDLAWWACWRSYDFTVDALEARHPGLIVQAGNRGIHPITGPDGDKWFECFLPGVTAEGGASDRGHVGFRALHQMLENLRSAGLGAISGVTCGEHILVEQVNSLRSQPVTWAYLSAGVTVESQSVINFSRCLLPGEFKAPSRRQAKIRLSACHIGALTIAEQNTLSVEIERCWIRNGLTLNKRTSGGEVDLSSNAVCGGVTLASWNGNSSRLDLPRNFRGFANLQASTGIEFRLRGSSTTKVRAQGLSQCTIRSAVDEKFDAISIDGEGLTIKLPGAQILRDLELSVGTRGTAAVSVSLNKTRIEGKLEIQGVAGKLNIKEAFVQGSTTLDSLKASEIDLSKSQFLGQFSAKRLESWAKLSGDHANFGASAIFDGVIVRDTISFRSATFEGEVRFDALSDGDSIADDYFAPVDFRGATFATDASFRGRLFKASSKFDASVWGGVPIFHQAQLHPDTSFVDAKFDKPTLSARKNQHSTDDDQKNELMGQYERAYRSLKLQAERLRAKGYESLFHRLEMHARRENTSAPWSERFVSWIYDITSRYGESYVRPGVLWGIQTVFFGISYWLIGLQSLDPTQRNFMNAFHGLELSLKNGFRPFYSSSPGFDRMMAIEYDATWPAQPYWHFVTQAMSDHPFCMKLLLTFQSLISIVLIFLILLGIRRKFQIAD